MTKLIFSVLVLFFLAIGCNVSKNDQKKEIVLNISGSVQLGSFLSKKVNEGDVIFLMAKNIEGGSPVAVKKFTGKSYPYQFVLTNQDLMSSPEKITGPLNLTVRVDKDGNAMTKMAGDLLGICKTNPVSLQSENIVLTVDEIMK